MHVASPSPLYLDTVDATKAFLASIRDVSELALDTEGASFHRYVDRIYLLQLSTVDRHAIIDPLRVTELDDLGRLLESPGVEVVFHDADYDLRLLHQDYGWHVRRIFDTRVAAQLLGIRAFGLAALLESFFGVKLDKKHQRADWSMRPLPPDMLRYAAQDTTHLLALRDRLRDALADKGRLSWAEEEFRLLEGTRWDDNDDGTAFLRLKGARDLSRRELAVLRELVTWRDAIARELDRSTFRVAGNEVLLTLSRTVPTTMQELDHTKGLGKSLVTRHGANLLAAIHRAQAVPEADLPRFPKSPRWSRDADYENRVMRLKGARDAMAADLDVDPGVLCPRERLEAIARRKPADKSEMAEVPELRRWQVDVLGDAFLESLRADAPSQPARP